MYDGNKSMIEFIHDSVPNRMKWLLAIELIQTTVDTRIRWNFILTKTPILISIRISYYLLNYLLTDSIATLSNLNRDYFSHYKTFTSNYSFFVYRCDNAYL